MILRNYRTVLSRPGINMNDFQVDAHGRIRRIIRPEHFNFKEWHPADLNDIFHKAPLKVRRAEPRKFLLWKPLTAGFALGSVIIILILMQGCAVTKTSSARMVVPEPASVEQKFCRQLLDYTQNQRVKEIGPLVWQYTVHADNPFPACAVRYSRELLWHGDNYVVKLARAWLKRSSAHQHGAIKLYRVTGYRQRVRERLSIDMYTLANDESSVPADLALEADLALYITHHNPQAAQ
jgi:hypothetical protein